MTAPSDTHPEIWRRMLEGYRRMSPTARLEQVQVLNESVLQLAAARIRKEQPGIGDRELRVRVAALWVDRALLQKALAWEVSRDGP